MFLRVAILVFAATCFTARVIDVSDKQSAWERSGKFEGDIILTEGQRNGLINTERRWTNKVVPFSIDSVFGIEGNLDKYDASTITSIGVPYDYDSVMHYGPYAFPKSGMKTIQPKDPNAQIGQRDGFSARDIQKLAEKYPDICDEQSAWERSGKFEGDIMLTEEQITNGLIKPGTRWPHRTVPYDIDDVFTDDERYQILLAIEDYHNKTPIRFKQYDPLTDRDYINITGEDDGCWSYVGRIGEGQPLNLQRGEFGCISHGTIIHELLHAVGFFHQHSATDRDDYVTINWQNIEEGAEGNFEKYNASTIASFGVPYDYDSVMHYGPCAFTNNGLETIEPNDPKATIGQREGFSEKDIEKLARMYSCPCRPEENSSSTTEEASHSTTEKDPSSTTEEASFSTTEEASNSTTEEVSSSTTEEVSYSTTEENSSYATRSQFITLIIITVHVLTHLQ